MTNSMSYIIATPFPSEKVRKRMWTFLEKQFQTANALTGSAEYNYLSNPLTGKDLFLRKRAPAIGFQYNSGCSPLERHYAWSLCSWMALQDGAQMVRGGTSAPCIFYENEIMPVCVLTLPLPQGWGKHSIVVDAIGFHPLTGGATILLKPKELKRADEVVKAELERLTDVYKLLKEHRD